MASIIQIAENRIWEGASASFDLIVKHLHAYLGDIDELNEPLEFALHANCKFMGLTEVSRDILDRVARELERLQRSSENQLEGWSEEGKQWFARDIARLIDLLRSDESSERQ